MNRSKKTVLIVLGVLLLAVAVGAVCVGLRVAPTVNHGLRISELLQPMLDAENQRMHIRVSAEISGNAFDMESDVFLVSEDGVSYFAAEQNGTAVYVADNVLFLENGKAFKIGEQLQSRTVDYAELLPRIGALYEVLKITAEETDGETVYSVAVTEDKVKTLLSAVSPWVTLPADDIEKLNLRLTERNGQLDQISFSGKGEMEGTSVMLDVTLSGFRILASGDYPIPEAVRHSAATVNRSELFSLTEDLYRLVLGFAPFADMDAIDGTLDLTVDCGPLQLDTRINLSDLNATSNNRIDPEKLQALPEWLFWLFMEGEIACNQRDDGYVYTLELDQAAIGELSRMILPELAQYGGDLTEGKVTVVLDAGNVASMNVSIKGKVKALFMQIPVAAGAEFTFG